MFLKTRGQVASQIKSPHARKRFFSVVVKTTQQLKREYLIEKVFPGKWGSNVTRGILNALLTHPSFITNSKSRSRLAPLKTNKSALAFPLNGNLNRRFEMDTDQLFLKLLI